MICDKPIIFYMKFCIIFMFLVSINIDVAVCELLILLLQMAMFIRLQRL